LLLITFENKSENKSQLLQQISACIFANFPLYKSPQQCYISEWMALEQAVPHNFIFFIGNGEAAS